MCFSISSGDDPKISHGRSDGGININGLNGCPVYHIKNATYCKCSDFPTFLCPGDEKLYFEKELYTQVHANECFSGQKDAVKSVESLATTVLSSLGLAALCAVLLVLLFVQRHHYTRGQKQARPKNTKTEAV